MNNERRSFRLTPASTDSIARSVRRGRDQLLALPFVRERRMDGYRAEAILLEAEISRKEER